jgi:hypothetical protein
MILTHRAHENAGGFRAHFRVDLVGWTQRVGLPVDRSHRPRHRVGRVTAPVNK